MNVIKLGLISFFVFYVILWLFSSILPNSSIVSRAANSVIKPDSLKVALSNTTLLHEVLLGGNEHASVKLTGRNYFIADQKITLREANSDTLFFEVDSLTKNPLQGGIAFFRPSADSTAVQLFYVFRASWYKPWEKFRMMYNDKAIGPLMDSAVLRLPK